MDKYLDKFKTCLQHEPPFCVPTCPFHLDVKDFIDKIKRGSFTGAYKTYRNSVGFPGIISQICPKYCEKGCPMNQSIDLHRLEQSTLSFAKNTLPPDYNLPKKQGSIAIVGGGLSGLGCLLRLATKKYSVTLFEESSFLGGMLKKEYPDLNYQEEFDFQLQHEEYTLHLDHKITSLAQLSDFDAVYIATGKNGLDFGLLENHLKQPCYLSSNQGIFGGGMLLGSDLVGSLAQGLKMGTTIDNFLKTKNLLYTKDMEDTKCVLDSSKDLSRKKTIPMGKEYTKEEAIEEASRCLKCQCDACKKYSDLVCHYNKWPLRIRDEIQATTLPGTSEVKATPAKRLISSDTLSGLFKEICPQNIDLDGLILEARKSMHRQDKLPWAFNEFFLKDLEFTDGDQAALVRSSKGQSSCDFAFFPGCQLGASDPSLVLDAYDALLKKDPSIGMFLSCCGIPALWAGDENLHKEKQKRILNHWQSLGKPTLVMACPSCVKHFSQYLPEIPYVYLYDLLDDLWKEQRSIKDGNFSVFDPCTVGNTPSTKKAVRQLATKAGCLLTALEEQEKRPACCGHGGHNAIANPEMNKGITQKRISLGEDPYIAYCINCRDSFLSQGKECYHILDLLFDKKPKLITETARRENRVYLKETLLKTRWEETMAKSESWPYGSLNISDNLKEKLSKERILEEDMKEVISYCEETHKTIYSPSTDTYSGYKRIGHSTFWAEYKKEGNQITLINGYTHRMEIEMEVVWNGRKREENM